MEPVMPEGPAEDLDDLREALTESDFSAVTFGSLNEDKPATLKVSAVIDANDPRLTTVAYWETPPGNGWFCLEGHPYRAPAHGPDEIRILGLPEDLNETDRTLLDHAVHQLREIHEIATEILEDGYELVRKTTFDMLDTLAEDALEYEDEDDDQPLEAWEQRLQDFTRQCRLGLFGGLSIDESTDVTGTVNVSAFVIDLDSEEPIELKIYWQAQEDTPAPSHWIALGNTAVEETVTGGNASYNKLLTGHTGEGREHLKQALLDLHQIARTATEIIMMKAFRPYEMLAEAQLDNPPRDTDMDLMSVTEAADALAGLNGIARLYTGTRPLNTGEHHHQH